MKNIIAPFNTLPSRVRFIVFVFLSLVMNLSLDAQVYVNQAASRADNGSSWANAYLDLKTAIANTSSGEIWVAQGYYYPSTNDDPFESFNLKNNVAIYGGFAGGETNLNNRDYISNTTILSGYIGSIQAYHVVSNTNSQNNTAILDGFTIEEGKAIGGGDFNNGGGMFNSGASPTIRNCTFAYNYAGDEVDIIGRGGGMYNGSFSNPQVINCTFDNNLAYEGGGMRNLSSNPFIQKCIFTSNQAQFGGGIYNSGTSCSIGNSLFINNSGILIDGAPSGGAMYNGSGGNPLITNCTINGTIFNGNISSSIITNSIVYNIADTGNGSSLVTFSIIYTFNYPCTNCITTSDSIFINSSDPDGPDNIYGTLDDGFNLIPNSPAINSGTNNGTFTDDILGNDRIGIHDIGAYEAECQANPIYVNAIATGNNSGISWNDAMTDLQEALDLVASCSVDTILVAQGTYFPSSSPDDISTDSRDKAFHIDNDVVVIGGFDPGTGTQTGAATILSGDNDNSYHVMVHTALTSAAVFKGLTFKDGNANGSGSLVFGGKTFARQFGGGIYNKASSPIYANCVFTDNHATVNGGGLYITDSSTIGTENCTFKNNNADQNGGGIGNAFGSTATVSNSFFESNTSDNGGGIANINTAITSIENSVFYGNTATTSGGGFYNTSAATAELTNNTFSGNATASGTNGGGISAAGNAVISNTILWDNGTEISGTPMVSNSIIQGGYSGCISCPNTDGNIDPSFVNIANPTGVDNIIRTIDDGLNLLGSSAAIDAGTSTESPSNDFLGSTRIGNPDIGAYEAEFQPTDPAEILKFDGVDDYVSWNTTFDNNSDYTIEAWVRFDSDPSGQSILALTDTSSTDVYCPAQLRVNDQGYLTHIFNEFGSGYKEVINPTKIRTHVWYYISIFRTIESSTEIGIRVDDETTVLNGFTVFASGISEIFLGNSACGSSSFDGEIEELRIWNKKINTKDQESITTDDSELIHYFRFNEGSGGLDNTNPIVNTIADPYNTEIAQLFNFELEGIVSNWMPCGPFSNNTPTSLFPIITDNVEQVVGDDMVLTSSISGAAPSHQPHAS